VFLVGGGVLSVSAVVAAASDPARIRVVAYDSVLGENVGEISFSSNGTKLIEIKPCPPSVYLMAECAIGSGQITVNTVTGAGAEGVTLESADLTAVYGTVNLDPGNAGALALTTGTCAMTSGAGPETRSLAAATQAGQMLTIIHSVTGGGTIVLTVADPHFDGTNNTVTFTAAGQAVIFTSIQVGAGYRWMLVVNSGAGISHV
jgi:hypothetical protein